ncbi:MAG: type II toxin-antitoxin system Phd/YefM family antitoxin [Brevundimonas sp.]|uniref:type II toxin-antitoxin system Phd/YefM family antitoxin n=1 Tax=Brevundimonas sp. TaxID=1871086 RepID=UPI0040334F21
MTVFTVHQAKTQLSRLIAAAERGAEVVIARGDKPAVRIVPFVAAEPSPPARRFGRLKGQVAMDDRFFEPLPEEELRLWEGRDD